MDPSLTRRRTLGALGLGSLALLGSSSPASAFFFGSRGSAQIDTSKFDRVWVARQGRNLQAYADYIAGLRLKRVTPQQVIAAHAKRRGSVWNSLPPKSMWKNMAPTLKALDRVAKELGTDVKEVVSAYRSPAYNARCSGASRSSWHKSNVALDVKFGIRPSVVSAKARAVRQKGYFKGGVGHYWGFTHIDTRGQNVDW